MNITEELGIDMWTCGVTLGFISDGKKEIIYDILMDFACDSVHEWDGEYGEWEDGGSGIERSIKGCMSKILEELGEGIK